MGKKEDVPVWHKGSPLTLSHKPVTSFSLNMPRISHRALLLLLPILECLSPFTYFNPPYLLMTCNVCMPGSGVNTEYIMMNKARHESFLSSRKSYTNKVIKSAKKEGHKMLTKAWDTDMMNLKIQGRCPQGSREERVWAGKACSRQRPCSRSCG